MRLTSQLMQARSNAETMKWSRHRLDLWRYRWSWMWRRPKWCQKWMQGDWVFDGAML